MMPLYSDIIFSMRKSTMPTFVRTEGTLVGRNFIGQSPWHMTLTADGGLKYSVCCAVQVFANLKDASQYHKRQHPLVHLEHMLQ